jgi:hypothetical protein
VNLGNRLVVFEDRFGHRVERVLYGETLVLGEGLEQRLPDALPDDAERQAVIVVAPGCAQRRRQDPVVGLPKRRVLVAEKSAEGRMAALQHQQIPQTGVNGDAVPRSTHDRRTLVVARPSERLPLRFLADRQPLPRTLGDLDARSRHGPVAPEKVR